MNKPLPLLLLAACLCGAGSLACAQTPTLVTIADKPLRIIRGATLFKAAGGTIVQKDDIVETAAGSAQLEAGPDTLIAMGPQTRILISSLAGEGKPAEVQLLQGWVKLASGGAARSHIMTAGLHTSFAGGAVIVNSKPGRDALFADEGEQQVLRIDPKGKNAAPVKLPPEQFAFALAAQALVVQARPTKDFLAEMPLQFRDRLAPAPQSVRAPKAPAVKEREVGLADVAPWLGASLPARKTFVARFRPLLKDPQTRKQLEQSPPGPEWKAVLKLQTAPGTGHAKSPPAVTPPGNLF